MQEIIEKVWENRDLLKDKEVVKVINQVVEKLDLGELRVAEPLADGSWKVNDWVKKAVILYFPTRKMNTIEVGPLEFHDKMALKTNYAKLGVRVVPHAIARYGSFLANGAPASPSTQQPPLHFCKLHINSSCMISSLINMSSIIIILSILLSLQYV